VQDELCPALDALVQQKVGAKPKLAGVPGTRCAYSNLGFLLLGQIIERVSGEPFETHIQRHVLDPLGCEASGFQPPAHAATGYQKRWSMMGIAASWLLERRFFGETIAGYRALKPFAVDGNPYGGLAGPVGDLLRFARMILGEGQSERGRVLKAQSVRAMLAPSRGPGGQAFAIGLGWHLGREDGHDFAYHLGGGGGFRSELRVYPQIGYAVAVLANETSFPTEKLTRLVVR
jgi:CubicO group peptidase (beta-lactamase class C family)